MGRGRWFGAGRNDGEGALGPNFRLLLAMITVIISQT
jgi:hypothetical protein